jgi:hypothetical protein
VRLSCTFPFEKSTPGTRVAAIALRKVSYSRLFCHSRVHAAIGIGSRSKKKEITEVRKSGSVKRGHQATEIDRMLTKELRIDFERT